MENTNSSKNKVIFVVVIVIVLAAVGVFFFMPASQPSAPTSGQPTVGQQNGNGQPAGLVPPPSSQAGPATPMAKADILSLVNSGKLLTDAQKQTVIQSLVGDKIKTYNFTDAEKLKIIQAINRTK